jgi:Mechanosensitive ion channel, conserved TM helix
MGSVSAWLDNLRATLAAALHDLTAYLPYLLGALALLGAGWIVARVLRVMFVKLAGGLNRVLERIARPAGTRRMRLSQPVLTLIGNVVFWVVILVFAAMAAQVGRLDAFSTWLDRIVAYVPTLVAGGMIALAGYLVSALVRDVVTTTVASTGSTHSELYGLAAQSAVFLSAVVIGLDQIGIDVTLLVTMLAIAMGGLMLAIVFAFGFGARAFVGNLIAAQQINRIIEPGNVVQVGGEQGQILEITATTVIMSTTTGRAIVPAKLFQEQVTQIVADHENE